MHECTHTHKHQSTCKQTHECCHDAVRTHVRSHSHSHSSRTLTHALLVGWRRCKKKSANVTPGKIFLPTAAFGMEFFKEWDNYFTLMFALVCLLFLALPLFLLFLVFISSFLALFTLFLLLFFVSSLLLSVMWLLLLLLLFFLLPLITGVLGSLTFGYFDWYYNEVKSFNRALTLPNESILGNQAYIRYPATHAHTEFLTMSVFPLHSSSILSSLLFELSSLSNYQLLWTLSPHPRLFSVFVVCMKFLPCTRCSSTITASLLFG